MTKKITIDDDMVRRAIKSVCGGIEGTDMYGPVTMALYRKILDAALNPPHEHKWKACGTSYHSGDVELTCVVCSECGASTYEAWRAFSSLQAPRLHHRKGDSSFSHAHRRSADRKPDSAHHTHKRSTDQ